ncbi:MAG: hypothetical protein KDA21_07790 [Phycisphaerales bacterium]|nr:hypothetical protein [Phycisphaerales bacterium]
MSDASSPILIRDFERVLRITIPARPSLGRWIAAAFWNGAWLFGIALFALLLLRLVDASMLALTGPITTKTALLLGATVLLLAWIVVWIAVGMYVVFHVVFAAAGRELHVITGEEWSIERRIGRWRQVSAYDMDSVFNLRPASTTRSAGLVFAEGTPRKHRTIAFASHVSNEELKPVLEAIRGRHPYLFSAVRREGEDA